MSASEILTLLQILVLLIGGASTVVLLRSQMAELTTKLGELTQAIKGLDASLDGHEKRISELEWERDHGRTRRRRR